MRLWISYNTSSSVSANLSIVNGWFYQCKDKDCNDTAENVVGIACSSVNPCESRYYPYTPYQKLAINFSDNVVRESGVFNVSYPGAYDVLVTDKDLVVTRSSHYYPETESASYWQAFAFAIALSITALIELLIAFAYLFVKKKSKWILVAVAVANIISVPILWIAVLTLSGLGIAVLITMEILVTVFEACLIYLMNKKIMTLKESFILSAAMNLGSIIIGGIILELLYL
jgi:hypothetical protein